ncbi:MAG: phosphoribosylanthranilate isomerase [Dehalococcoidia bacterium]
MRVKICGITNLEDALAAVEFGADMLGFIFASSPRQVEPEHVREITVKIPADVIKVGVFVDSQSGEIIHTVKECHLDMVQLHGNESPEFCAALPFPIIKAFTPESLPSLSQIGNYGVDFLMLDRSKGSHELPEKLWPIAKELTALGRIILAGALTPEIVAEAVKIARPYAVDVASGVEERPGKKDHSKIRDFITEAKREEQN